MEVSQSLLTPRGHSREQGPPECSHLLVPAGLPPAGQGRVHDVVSHQEKGLELREAGLGTGCPPGVPSPGSCFSPARYTSPRPGRSGGSPGPAARGPPAAGTRPPPSALGCISRPARCTPAPAGARRREQPWPAAPRPGPPALPTPPPSRLLARCPLPAAPHPGPAAPALTHLLQPRHGVSHLRVPQPVLRQVADDLREEGGELLALARCPRPGLTAAAHGAGSRSRRCHPRPPRPGRPRPRPVDPLHPPRGARRDAQSRGTGAAPVSTATGLQLPMYPASERGLEGTRLE